MSAVNLGTEEGSAFQTWFLSDPRLQVVKMRRLHRRRSDSEEAVLRGETGMGWRSEPQPDAVCFADSMELSAPRVLSQENEAVQADMAAWLCEHLRRCSHVRPLESTSSQAEEPRPPSGVPKPVEVRKKVRFED